MRAVLARVLLLNLLVVAVKVIVGVRTEALAVLGAALESSLDTINNVIGMVLVSVAARAPDEEHPYGHGKFETLGALAIVGFLSISCFELLREGIAQLRGAHTPRVPTALEIVLVGVTLGVNALIVWYERMRARELSSAFLLADSAHTGSDVYVTLLSIASLVLARYGLGTLDPVLAIVVALLIAWNGYRILRDTVPILVDERAVSTEEVRRLISGIDRISEVRSVRSRTGATGELLAEVTIGVDGTTSVEDAHRLADEVEERIAESLGASQVTVHVEPT